MKPFQGSLHLAVYFIATIGSKAGEVKKIFSIPHIMIVVTKFRTVTAQVIIGPGESAPEA